MSVSYTGGTIPAAGATGTVAVSTSRECTWSASTAAAWLALSASQGQGSGAVNFTASANTAVSQRRGTVTIAGQPIELTQLGAACEFDVAPASVSMPAGAGRASLTVTALQGCSWTASAGADWITIASGGSGSGNGAVEIAVAPNAGGSRSASVTVAGRPITVAQAAGDGGCAYTLSRTTQTVDAAGANLSVDVTAAPGCGWTVVSDVAWITVVAGTPGSGNGRVTFAVATNSGAARSGTLTIAGQTFTVSQQSGAPSCAYNVQPTSRSVPVEGGSTTIAVTAADGCTWTASSAASWITVRSGATGAGNGSVELGLAPNTGPARTGTVSVAGQTVTVSQAGAEPCTFSVAPAGLSVGTSGGPGSFQVNAGSGCAWSASSQADWITITGGGSGTGTGTVSFSVAANTGGARSGTIGVAGQTFTITQAGTSPSCSIALQPTSTSVAAAGGSGTVTVTAGAGCTWAVAVNDTWITLTGAASGTGSGAVSYSVAANPGAARTGSLTIGGQTFSIAQAETPANCTISLQPSSASVGAGASTGTVNVAAPAGCPWSASSTAGWLTITSGASGSGAGAIEFRVDANTTSAPRTAALTIGGQTFTVTQASPCNPTVAPNDVAVASSGGAGSVAVTISAGCAWTAASNASWITVTAGASGNGAGTVTFQVDVNTLAAARTGTLTVAGQPVTVRQAGATCTFAASPTQARVANGGGSVTINVTAPGGCAWTATSNANWLTISAGQTGNGNGSVVVTVLNNTTGSARQGTLSVAGQTVTVNQDP